MHSVKTIGFYGGTFDPIHFGHINLALQLAEIHHLDEVLFCPAYRSPFKTALSPHATPQHRLEMVRIVVTGIPHFRVTAYEVDRNDLSFTIDTLRRVMEAPGEILSPRKKGEGVKFRLILSEEAAAHFDQWKDFQELIHIAPPLIGTRSKSSLRGKLADSFGCSVTKTAVFEISSTEIRARLKKGLYCGHLVPEKVLEYIEANGLYTN